MPGKILISSEYPQNPSGQCSPIVWNDTNNVATAITTGPIPLGIGWWCHISPSDNTKMLVLSKIPYWSHNNGASWSPGSGVGGSKLQRAIKFGSLNNAYFCGFPDTSATGGIFKSTDNGINWTNITPASDANLCTGLYPVASFLVFDDCPNNEFSIEVNISSFGGSSGASISYVLNHDLNSPVLTISSAVIGTSVIGPFSAGERVKIIVTGSLGASCTAESSWLNGTCTILPNPAIVNTYYYCPTEVSQTLAFNFSTSCGFGARMFFAQGRMNMGTVIRLYDGTDNTGVFLAAGSYPDLTNLEVYALSGNIYMEIETDANTDISCDGERDLWIFNVDCFSGCARPLSYVTSINETSPGSYSIDVETGYAPTGSVQLSYNVNGGPYTDIGGILDYETRTIGTFSCGDIINIIITNESESPGCTRNNLDLGWIYISSVCGAPVNARESFYLDVFPLDDNRVFTVTNKNNPYGTDSFLLKTLDGGATWIKEFRLNDVLPVFNRFETARRIWMLSEFEGYVLARGKFYKIQKIGPNWIGTTLWNFLPQIAANWDQLPTGALDQWGSDSDFLFDQIHVHQSSPTEKSVWLFGNYGLMARSTVQDTTFQFINTGFVVNDPSGGYLAHSTGYFESENSGWIAYSNVLTGLAGIWYSSNSGDGLNISVPTIYYPQSGGSRWVMQNMWFSGVASAAEGCTNSTSCNYDGNAVFDDGSCQHAITLTDCETGSTIVTTNQDVFWYSCIENYIDFNVQGVLLPSGTDHALTVTLFDGVSTNGYTFNYQTYLTSDPSSVTDFINGFVGWWNTNAGTNSIGTAYQIPPGFNTLTPGGNNGVRIVLNSNYNTVSYSATNLIGFTFTSVNPAEQGKVLRLSEYPNQCWRACGPGNCVDSEDVVITDVFDDCFTCVPYRSRDLCLNCNTMVTVNDLPISECPSGCINVGDFININLAVGFPVREQVEIQPEEYSETCCNTCKLTLSFSGDQSEYFPVGSVIGVYDLNTTDTIAYTVESVIYDEGTDLTVITTVEFCSNVEIGNVTAFYECECQAAVTIARDEETLINESYECEDGYIQQGIQYAVTEPGSYIIRIEASDCGGKSVCEYRLKICPRYSIYKDCHDVTFTNETPNNAPNMIIEIFDTEQNVILAPTSTNLVEYVYQFEEDGVYIVRLTPADINNIAVGETEEYSIFVLCDTISCVKKLILDLWCNDDDGCCDGCTDEERKRRDQINRIMAIASMLFANQYVNKINFILDKNENVNVLKTAELLERLRLLIDRCGECEHKESTKTKKSGCQNC